MRRTSLDCVHELARLDKRVVFIGSDLGAGVLESMRTEMPERWFMEGVAEQHIIGMAAGLALEGFIPYVNTIATFLTRRCYEQLVVDICLHRLPVRLIGNGGGVVYAPLGPTHQATDDFAIMRVIPNMTVVAPCDADEMRRLMETTLDWPDPIYIRLAKGGDKIISSEENGFEIGKGIVLRRPGEVLLVTTGIMTQRALGVAEKLEKFNIYCGVLHLHTLKPCDKTLIIEMALMVNLVITIEEHQQNGGLGSTVLEVLADANLDRMPQVLRKGIPDQFAQQYGSQESLLEHWGLDVDSLANTVKEAISG